MKAVAVAGTLALVLLAAVAAGAHNPPAEAKCQPYSVDQRRIDDGRFYKDGWYRDGAAGGVYSRMLNYSPWVQPGTNTSAWVMLETPSLGQWAQVGWMEYQSDDRRTFVEWTTGYYNWHLKDTFAPQPVGDYTYYTTLYNYTPGKFTFQVAGSTIWEPAAAFTPSRATTSGETHSLASQMPGGYHNFEAFTETNIWLNGSWQLINGTPLYGVNTTYFGFITGSSSFWIWDRACAY